jgi:hypothetical protein
MTPEQIKAIEARHMSDWTAEETRAYSLATGQSQEEASWLEIASRYEHQLTQAEAERNALLAAAKAAHEWICSVTNWEDGVPYVNGKYDSNVNLLDAQLRVAIEKTRKP